MVEFQRNQDREPSAMSSLKICVAGIGGGGLNVLDRICLDRLMDVTLVSMHTDVRVLGHAMAPLKIQLGAEMMRGIGCGGDPELGREAADASSEQIRAALQGHEMVFICTGLGGGTGSGAAPVVAQIARELGAMVFIFATMPFSFEGRRRLTQAEMALEDLQRNADAVILFENNRMGELVLPKEGIQKAFSQADQLIGHSVRAISTMVTQPGVVRMGLADLMTALRSPNARCLFGFGEARGTNRVQESLKRALKSPLVNQGQLLQNARNLLVHIAGGESLTLAEVESLMKQLGKYVPDETQIMFGLAVDPKLGDMMTVTLISSLTAQQMSLEPSADAVVEPRVASRPQPAPPRTPVEKAPAYSGNGLQLHAPVGEASEPEPPVAPVQHAPAPAPVQQAASPTPAPVAVPASAPKAVDPLPAELFAEFHEQPVAQAPAPAPAPTQPAPQPRQAAVVSVPVQMQEVPLFEEPAPQALAPAPAPAPAAPLMMEAPQPLPVPAPAQQPVRTIAQTPAPVYAPEPAVQAQAQAHMAPAPVAPAPQPEPEPVRAEAPVHETVEPEMPVVKEQSIKAASILVQPHTATPPHARHEEEEVKPLVKQSIFSMVEDEEEEEEEQDEDEEFVDEMEDEAEEQEEEETGSVEARSPEAAGAHWADKYIQPKPHAGVQPSVEPRREPQRTLQTTAAAPAKKVIEAKQPSLNLQQEEVARFKGTDKTIVDGDDLDIPTWMRMRGKVKR